MKSISRILLGVLLVLTLAGCGDLALKAIIADMVGSGTPATPPPPPPPPTYYFGYYNQLPDFNGYNTTFLYGEKVVVTANSLLTGFGVVVQANNTANVIMSLYTDLGGVPSQLVAYTASTALFDGRNEIAVTGTPLVAGNYWIMVQYDWQAFIYIDIFDPQTLYYISWPYGTPPATIAAPIPNPWYGTNYYIIAN